MTRAFITGIAGQDGSYLAELLLKKATKCMASSCPDSCWPIPGSLG